MSELARLSQSDFIRECQRLHARHLEAIQGEDAEALDAAIDAFAHFLRMNAAGRLQEYFDARALAARNDA